MAGTQEHADHQPSRGGDDVLLRDGTIAQIRQATAVDGEALLALHDGLSDDSRYFRFFQLGKRSGELFVESLVHRIAEGDAVAFVAMRGERVVGLGSYIRTGEISDASAEVAFVVADDFRSLGIGTLLLERLADHAEHHDITTFVGTSLATNNAMLQVFRYSGFAVEASRDREVIEVRLPVHLTETFLEAIAARERQTDAASIGGLLCPGSVAVIGASRRPDAPGHVVLRNLLDGGFTGPVYPVNPAAGQVRGRTAYPSVLDVPGTIDLAVIAVPATVVPTVVEQCAAKHVRNLVILSAGFAETGDDGRALQNRVLELARAADMRMVGPNCLGIANTDPAVALNATFSPVRLLPGQVGLMTQSGAVGIAALQRADDLGIGLSSFVSAGNKADVSGNDMLMYSDGDEHTNVIALYLESFGNPRKFARLARHVSTRKPIVALIGGATETGQRAAAGHTAGAVTSSTAVDALFRQCGVIRTHSLEQLLHVASLLSCQPLPRGRRVAIVSNGGGPGVLAADACAQLFLDIAKLETETAEAIHRAVPGAALTDNPVDLGAGTTPSQFARVVQLVGADLNVDAVIAVHTPVPGLDDDEFTVLLQLVADHMSGKTTLAVMLGKPARHPIGAQTTDPARSQSGAQSEPATRVPVFGFPEDAARALVPVMDHVAWNAAAPTPAQTDAPRKPHGQASGQPYGDIPDLPGLRERTARRLIAARLTAHPDGCRLGVHDTKQLLDCYGIDVTPAVLAIGVEAAVDAANLLGYPVVLKIADPSVVHKAEAGGVRLNLTDAEAVRRAYEEMAAAAGKDETGVLMQPQATPGPELIVGVVQDPVFGPLVMFGLGGTTADLLADRVFRLTPLTANDAASATHALRSSPLLFGYRGLPACDVTAVEDLLVRVGRLADDLPQIAEIDLNPVIAHEHGLAIVDAKVRLQPSAEPVNPALPRLRPPSAHVTPNPGSPGRA